MDWQSRTARGRGTTQSFPDVAMVVSGRLAVEDAVMLTLTAALGAAVVDMLLLLLEEEVPHDFAKHFGFQKYMFELEALRSCDDMLSL